MPIRRTAALLTIGRYHPPHLRTYGLKFPPPSPDIGGDKAHTNTHCARREEDALRVLIASPDPLARRALAALLHEWGHETVTAQSGDEAWRVLNDADPPSLAVLEWALAGADAPTLCTRLRDRPDAPYVYTIVVSRGAGEREAQIALECGADDFVSRPLEHNLLKLRLRAAEHIITLQQDFRESRQALEYKSTHDCLTGTWNRAEVLGILDREIARSQREGWPVSVIMIDVDRFKDVNDTYGHLAGDAALREITARIMTSLRPYDIIGRYGGEEFVLVLGGCSPRNALALAERLRELVADGPIELSGQEATVTISMGVATWSSSEYGDIQSLLRAADAALYRAKRSGRNRVEAAWHERVACEAAIDAA